MTRLVLVISALLASTSADPTDWVNVAHFSSWRSLQSDASTQDAQRAVVRGADAAKRHGPYTIVNSKGVAAPSEDPHDYLSWAPYHWPDCNWCGGGGTTYITPNQNDTSGDSGSNTTAPSNNGPDYLTGDSDFDDDPDVWESDYAEQSIAHLPERDLSSRHRMLRKKRQSIFVPLDSLQVPTPTTPLTNGPQVTSLIASSTSHAVAGSNTPAQAAAKSHKSKSKHSQCTPSPTKSMAPSATWTTCPYIIRDGKVNPDVRKLRGAGAMNKSSQQSIYFAMSLLITGATKYADAFVKSVSAFYLDADTAMNPNMDFGQVSRGPGSKGKQGTFTGVLDGRGHCKSINGMLLMRALGHPSWTRELDEKMMQWMSTYNSWLSRSPIAQKAASRHNNHGTFFCAQWAATRLALNDHNGAKEIISHFVKHEFQDQIAASGEQPFEAVRTRPFHYRCFNLEGLIVMAKIAEEVGFDMWTQKTKHGATIQTAADYLMRVDPKREKIVELVPHIVSVSRAYGDPHKNYAAFLDNAMPKYRTKPFWLYNQAPPISRNKRSSVWKREDIDQPKTPFVCPLSTGEEEIEDGLFVTCEDLRPYYEILDSPAPA